MSSLPGAQLEHFEFIAWPVAGEMGVVCRQRDTGGARAGALEVPSGEPRPDAARVRRLRQELRVTSPWQVRIRPASGQLFHVYDRELGDHAALTGLELD